MSQNSAQDDSPTKPHALLHGLLDYLVEQAKEIDPRWFRLAAHKDFIRRRDALCGLPGVEVGTGADAESPWLRVQRLAAHIPPAILDKEQAKLLRVPNEPDSGKVPELNESALADQTQAALEAELAVEQAGHGSIDSQLPLALTPQREQAVRERVRQAAQAALAAYMPQWTTWAKAEKFRRRSIALYGELFSLEQRLREDTANPAELVWGIGIATWRLTYLGVPLEYEYPLLTQELEVEIDNRTLAIEVRPRAVAPKLETDAFVACDVTSAIETERGVREQMAAPGAPLLTPFDSSSYSALLRRVAGNMDSLGQYLEVKESDAAVPAPGDHLAVTDDWVLLARPRRAEVMIVDIARLKAALERLATVPTGPAGLVTPGSKESIAFEPVKFRGVSSAGVGNPGAASNEVHELYFPEPYNQEQETIVQHLERAAGVTVQGPPGTGKTHTIANIICHYLATGRRVLVTSAGEPALRVLQQKIPDEVRALTVALLTNDREGQKQFEASIRVIQQQVTQLHPAAYREQIRAIKGAIDLAHAEINAIDRRVNEIALAQLSDAQLDGVPMRAQKLAELVVSGEQTCGWFPDVLTLDAQHAPPLTEEAAAQLRAARRALGEDLVYVGKNVPLAENFPTAREVASLHGTLTRIKMLDAQTAQARNAALKGTDADVLAAAAQLLQRLTIARELVQALEEHEEPWPGHLRQKCRQERFATERRALEALFAEFEQLAAERETFLQRPVELPESALSCAKTRQAVQRGAESGKPFGVFSFGAGDAKQHVAAIKIAALEPRSSDDWAHVARYFTLHEKVLVVSARWNQFAPLLGLPVISGGVPMLRSIEMVADLARTAHRVAMEFDTTLPQQAQGVLLEVDESDYTGASSRLTEVIHTLQRHLTRAELAAAAIEQVTLQSRLDGKAGPVVDQMLDFITQRLGDESASEQTIALEFDALLSELRRLAGLSSQLALISDMAGVLRAAGAKNLAEWVSSRVQPAAGDDVALPHNWREAWNWTRMRSYLEGIEARQELLEKARRRHELEAVLKKLYRDLVAKSAWLSTKENATGAVMAALNGYANAMRRVGRGTGLNAPRYLRDAREAMLQAVGAVPCWIMSHARVSESMPAEIGAFDLVVVDEASQSNLWALPAILRAKKILVVGDDKQVSPTGGFIEAARINELRSRFLSAQPYGPEMTPEKSLYDLASRAFAANQVMLREHFRCTPPIIGYSNALFYDNKIQPLRVPKGNERIEPPLVDIYVPHGVRQRDVNQGEAQAIAAEVEALLADPRFDGRTIGVVTLMSGQAQAKAIDSEVRMRCDAGELLRRKFEVGDAATFQGSERDIVFLSMVVSPNSCHALSGLQYEQRFNVAASRARDRMYLVRSVELSDLSDKDLLRRRLLQHFQTPLVVQDAQSDDLLSRCESGFEREVFSALTQRGYRVVPQVPAGAYRIDMVVEGDGDRRLALECDGDAFHGPDRWESDMARQRVLERAGWTFWRCFASTWTLQREQVLAELLERLAAMGIEPVGALEKAPLLVERRIYESEEDLDGAQSMLDLAVATMNEHGAAAEGVLAK